MMSRRNRFRRVPRIIVKAGLVALIAVVIAVVFKLAPVTPFISQNVPGGSEAPNSAVINPQNPAQVADAGLTGPAVAAALPVDVCAGLPTGDLKVHPMTALAKPALLQGVRDPQFGTTIRLISAASTADGSNAVVKPAYSTMQAWNADESLMLVWQRAGGGRTYRLLNGKTYQFIKNLQFAATDLEQVMWDPVNPFTIYYPSNYNGHSYFFRYNVLTNKTDLLHNFDDICGVGNSAGLGSDPMYQTWQATGTTARVIGLKCGNLFFTYDFVSNTILGRTTQTAGYMNAPQVAPSGTLVYWLGNVYDTALKFIRKLPLGGIYEHADTGRSSDGHDFYASVVFDPPAGKTYQGSLVKFDMTNNAVKVIIGPNTGYPYPRSGTHVSAIATHNSDWVAVSSVGNKAGQALLDQEILVANVLTGKVCRVAHHRSNGGDGLWGYWAEPHAVISPSGTRVLFASDWGGGNTVDAYVVELPSYHP